MPSFLIRLRRVLGGRPRSLAAPRGPEMTQSVCWRTVRMWQRSTASRLGGRSFVMGCLNIASPIGAFSAGFIAPPVLEAFGWRGAFVIGGVAPVVLAVIAVFMPESLKFLIARRPADPRIARILRRIAPDVDPATVRAQPALQ